MDEKTILEELLDGSTGQTACRKKLDKANHLLEQGHWSEADVLFDEVLASDPLNKEALCGKRLISRQVRLEQRLSNVSRRAETAVPAEMPRGNNPLRSKGVLTAVVIAFVLVCAAAAVFVGFNLSSDKPDAEAQDTQIVQTENRS